MKRTMTSRERVVTALHCAEPDRVPINYSANPGIDRRLKEHYGLDPSDSEGLRQVLGVDFRGIGPSYTGPKLQEDIPERNIDMWGIHTRWVEHESGGYWDFCDFPLKYAMEEKVARWPMPNPDDFDYSDIPQQCEQWGTYAVSAGGAGTGDIINSAGMIRGMEQVLVDLYTDDPAGLLYIDRRAAVLLEVTRRAIEAAKGRVDFLWMGEDLGTQQTPLISLDLYRKHIRPRHQKFVDMAKSFDLPVMIHTCGSSSWAYEDFVEMGFDAVDTLQPEATNMSPRYLKDNFGGRLAFHGCISTAGPVANGTVDDVVADVRETLDIMMPGGGYMLAPTHQLQDNSPTENVVAMYGAAKEFGVY
jgi:uroporphyrinogen decarboxylase